MPGNMMRTSVIVSSRVVAVEAGREQIDERPAREHAERARSTLATSASSVPTARATRDASSSALGEQPRVDRDERRRQHALAEQVLQEVRDPQRGAERVGRRATGRGSARSRARARGRRSATGRCPRRRPARRQSGEEAWHRASADSRRHSARRQVTQRPTSARYCRGLLQPQRQRQRLALAGAGELDGADRLELRHEAE